MTEQEAKVVIRTPGYPNVAEVLEAFDVAYEVLGKDASLQTDIRDQSLQTRHGHT